MKSKSSVPGNKSRAKGVDNKTKEKEPVRPHVKASLEDINWLRSQAPCVQQLWFDCVAVEQFGCQLRKLETHLSSKSFRIAKTALEKRELFRFEAITQVSPSGRSNIMGWKIENLHGYYYKAYWETVPPEREVLPATREKVPATREEIPASGKVLPAEREILPDVAPENRAMTYSAKTEPTLNQMLTTPLPPTKVVEGGSCISQETHQTPLGGAGATSGEMQEEEEDAPDTSTASVEDEPEVNGTPINLGEDQSSAGGDIAKQPNSDEVETVEGDREGADDDDEVGHADIIEAICVRVQEHYYYPTEEQKVVMMQLTISQLQVLSERFQKQMSQRMSLPSPAKTKLAFEFALGLAFGKPLSRI